MRRRVLHVHVGQDVMHPITKIKEHSGEKLIISILDGFREHRVYVCVCFFFTVMGMSFAFSRLINCVTIGHAYNLHYTDMRTHMYPPFVN